MSTRTPEHSERGRRNGLKGLESKRARAELDTLKSGLQQVITEMQTYGHPYRDWIPRLEELLAGLSDTRGNTEQSGQVNP